MGAQGFNFHFTSLFSFQTSQKVGVLSKLPTTNNTQKGILWKFNKIQHANCDIFFLFIRFYHCFYPFFLVKTTDLKNSVLPKKVK